MTLVNVVAVAVAAFVASIGFFSWLTAHNRLVLDLVQRRIETYEDLRKVISDHLTSGQVSHEMLYRYISAANRARFLFGPEVYDYLKERYADLVRARFAFDPNIANQRGPQEERAALEQLLDRLTAFHDQTDRLFMPYMGMHQKIRRLGWRNGVPELASPQVEGAAPERNA
jgi:hypothetical protein